MKDFSDVLCYFPGKVGKLISDTINNSNNAIITKDFQIHVSEPETDTPAENTIIGNTTENTITEIPKTGLSFGEMGIYAIFTVLIIVITYMLYMKKIKSWEGDKE